MRKERNIGAPHGSYYSYVFPRRGRVDGHKNFDGYAEGDTSLPDHFVVAKLAKEKKEGKRETEEK